MTPLEAFGLVLLALGIWFAALALCAAQRAATR
jgi:hypothetical protein